MQLRFASHPGRHERHLHRRHLNPLFGNPPPCVQREELDLARSRDQKELQEFMDGFSQLIQQTTDLKPTSDSETVLRLKERLDLAYEQASGLAGDLTAVKRAIVKLLGVIMDAVRRGAGADVHALDELRQEDAAREMHFRLLEHALVADLLAPDSPVGPEELTPALLCAANDELEAVLQLFDPPHLIQMVADAHALLGTVSLGGGDLGASQRRMAQIENRLDVLGVRRQ